MDAFVLPLFLILLILGLGFGVYALSAQGHVGPCQQEWLRSYLADVRYNPYQLEQLAVRQEGHWEEWRRLAALGDRPENCGEIWPTRSASVRTTPLSGTFWLQKSQAAPMKRALSGTRQTTVAGKSFAGKHSKMQVFRPERHGDAAYSRAK